MTRTLVALALAAALSAGCVGFIGSVEREAQTAEQIAKGDEPTVTCDGVFWGLGDVEVAECAHGAEMSESAQVVLEMVASAISDVFTFLASPFPSWE